MKTHLGLFVFLLCSTTAQADLYKWVDEQGKIHYSDQPASGKTKSETKLEISNPSSGTATPDKSKSWQEKDLDYKKRQASAAENEAKKQKEAQETKIAQENCTKAKNSLSQLESIAPVYSYNETTGRSYLNEAQRTEAIEKARKSVVEWCK